MPDDEKKMNQKLDFLSDTLTYLPESARFMQSNKDVNMCSEALRSLAPREAKIRRILIWETKRKVKHQKRIAKDVFERSQKSFSYLNPRSRDTVIVVLLKFWKRPWLARFLTHFCFFFYLRKPSFNNLLQNADERRNQILVVLGIASARVFKDAERRTHDTGILVAKNRANLLFMTF